MVLTVPTTGCVVRGLIGAISGGRMRAPVTQPDTTYPGYGAVEGLMPGPRRRARRVSGLWRRKGLVSDHGDVLAFQDTAWKGTLKTVVQRPSPWLTLRLPPRASTRRRAPSRPRPEEKAS